VAVHRPRRHRLQPSGSRRASRQAREAQEGKVALSCQGEG
jgi:hypothetical protein